MSIGENVERAAARNRRQADEDDQLSGRSLGRLEQEVDRASALVHESVGRLTRHYPEHAICGAALNDLQRAKPHLRGALAALEEIERRRGLTQSDLSRRRAFKMLLEGAGEG